jgi:NitT/TauT family transport system ATP-binding protein
VLQRDLLTLSEHSGKTVVFVTHDIAEAISLSDRVLVVGRHPMSIRAEYHVSIPRPRDLQEIASSHLFQEMHRALRAEMQRACE